MVVIGVGNILLRDEGLGVRAVERLRERGTRDGVDLLDGGTLGLELLPLIESADVAIVVDAVLANAPPGSLVRLEGRDLSDALTGGTTAHQVGLAEVMALARLRGRLPRRLVLLGLVPAAIEPGDRLSFVIADGLDALVDAVSAEVEAARAESSPHDGRGTHTGATGGDEGLTDVHTT